MKEKFYVDTDEANISRAEVFRVGKGGIFEQKVMVASRVRPLAVGLCGFHIEIQFDLNFALD